MALFLQKPPMGGWGEREVETLNPNLHPDPEGAGAADRTPSAQEMALFLQKLPTGGWGECEMETLKPKPYP